jgi:hypothetical protein
MKWFALWFAQFIKGVNYSYFSWLHIVSLGSIVSSMYVNKRIIEYNIHFGKHFIRFCADWYNIFSGVFSQLIKLWTYFTANTVSHLTLSFFFMNCWAVKLYTENSFTHTHTHIQKPKRNKAFVFLSMVYTFVFNEAIIYPWELGKATWPLQHCNKIFTRRFEDWRKDKSTKTSELW